MSTEGIVSAPARTIETNKGQRHGEVTMRALTVTPGVPDSLTLRDVGEPQPIEGPLLIEGLSVGVCGTDSEIIAGRYGQPPPGDQVLILGHENLGRVQQAPPGSGFTVGDLVVTIVRCPDPEPCPACAAGEWDMCRNGRYTEHGIRGRHGFARQRWRAAPDSVIRLDPNLGRLGVLLEPTTIVAKAWEQIERIGRRAFWQPQVVAVTGAGPVGLLAALLGVQRGLRVHVFDPVADGPKPDLVHSLGATYHQESLADSGLRADVAVECSGAADAVVEVITCRGLDAIVCLTGVSGVGTVRPMDVGGLNRELVLGNDVVFGTVNANKRHYEQAARALVAADPQWLSRLITRVVPLRRYPEAFARQPDDVKVVLDLHDDQR